MCSQLQGQEPTPSRQPPAPSPPHPLHLGSSRLSNACSPAGLPPPSGAADCTDLQSVNSAPVWGCARAHLSAGHLLLSLLFLLQRAFAEPQHTPTHRTFPPRLREPANVKPHQMPADCCPGRSLIWHVRARAFKLLIPRYLAVFPILGRTEKCGKQWGRAVAPALGESLAAPAAAPCLLSARHHLCWCIISQPPPQGGVALGLSSARGGIRWLSRASGKHHQRAFSKGAPLSPPLPPQSSLDHKSQVPLDREDPGMATGRQPSMPALAANPVVTSWTRKPLPCPSRYFPALQY